MVDEVKHKNKLYPMDIIGYATQYENLSAELGSISESVLQKDILCQRYQTENEDLQRSNSVMRQDLRSLTDKLDSLRAEHSAELLNLRKENFLLRKALEDESKKHDASKRQGEQLRKALDVELSKTESLEEKLKEKEESLKEVTNASILDVLGIEEDENAAFVPFFLRSA
jgi:predicted RNase H-like nuclease (RuvC/YqgF family)